MGATAQHHHCPECERNALAAAFYSECLTIANARARKAERRISRMKALSFLSRVGSSDSSASVAYDHATRLQIMGIICEVADVVNVSEVKRCADRVMATMARRKKPNRLWAVEAVVLPNNPVSQPVEHHSRKE